MMAWSLMSRSSNDPTPYIHSVILTFGINIGVGSTPIDMSKIKKGDVIPRWLLARPNGSRGDITAAAKYDKGKGKWTLELSRKLVTDDPEHDVQFGDLSQTYYFGIAVWENDRLYGHTRVKKPIALTFK